MEASFAKVRNIDQVSRVVGVGLLDTITEIPPDAVRTLGAHIGQECEALASGDFARSSDFHTRVAEIFGNDTLVGMLRDLTVRTTLISMRHHSRAKASESRSRHRGTVDALEAGEFARAGQLMDDHIRAVEAGLDLTANAYALAGLGAHMPVA